MSSEVAARKPVYMVLSGPSSGSQAQPGFPRPRVLPMPLPLTWEAPAPMCPHRQWTGLAHLRKGDCRLALPGSHGGRRDCGRRRRERCLVDVGGLLKVGPRSVGADPGPAAYNKGGNQPTVTDANLVSGTPGMRKPSGGEIPCIGNSPPGH